MRKKRGRFSGNVSDGKGQMKLCLLAHLLFTLCSAPQELGTLLYVIIGDEKMESGI